MITQYLGLNKILPSALLVEDTLMVQKIHAWVLEGLGFQVDIAATGKQALKLLAAKKATGAGYKIALIDMGLPDIPGIEVVKAIKKQYCDTKAIVVTAYASDEVMDNCEAVGGDLVLEKPITTQMLKAYLDTA